MTASAIVDVIKMVCCWKTGCKAGGTLDCNCDDCKCECVFPEVTD